MKSVKIISETDADGKLRIEVPSELRKRRVEVLVVWHEVSSDSSRHEDDIERKAIRRSEIEKLAGALEDDPIERPDQGTFEEREPP